MIHVRDLRVRYPGATRPAVSGVSFSVSEGEIFGFLGPSGAGKSTTQKVLTGALRVFDGTVEVTDRDVRRAGRKLYEQIGVGFEVPNLFGKLTSRENLEFFARLYSGPVEDPMELLERVGLADAADERAERMSKGMRSRLNLARAFLNRPRLVFLDEPTSGLDPGTASLVKTLIREKRQKGTTVFLTTHNMTVADQLCDRVGFIVDGQLSAIDSPKQLKLAYGTERVRVEYREDGTVAAREFPLEEVGRDEGFLRLLREAHIETIHSLEATLEDVFLQVTGRSLDGDGGGDGGDRPRRKSAGATTEGAG
jgi:fluoroquinolone transport system ATP-binding protein